MIAFRTRFDGKTIEVPDELKDGQAGEVILIVSDSMLQSVSPHPSVWDVIAMADGRRTAEEIDRQIKSERESWD